MRPASEPTSGSLADSSADADPESVARSILLRRLTMAPRTLAELRDDLAARNVPNDVAEHVLQRFVDVGLINDGEYARMWVSSRHRSKGTAKSVLRQEMRRKGIDDDSIETALEQVSADDELVRARALVEAKLPSLSRYDTATQSRRLTSMLQRRGYSAGLAWSVVRELVVDDSGDVD